MIGRIISAVFVFIMMGSWALAQTKESPVNVSPDNIEIVTTKEVPNPRLDIGVLKPERQMDFWLGEWNVKWERGEGTNSVRRTLDGKVIQENFLGNWDGKQPYNGKSFSIYVASEKKWKQTWVDNQGGYVDLTGNAEGSSFILMHEQNSSGQKILQRMLFTNIRRNSFTWEWQLSRNDGTTWQTQWTIEYTRKK